MRFTGVLLAILLGAAVGCSAQGSRAGGTAPTKVDIPTGPPHVVKTLPVGGKPWAAAIDSEKAKIYLSDPDQDAITVVDKNGQVTATITGVANPQTLVADPSHDAVYAPNAGCSGKVTVVDTEDDQIRGSIAVGAAPTAATISPTSGQMYVINHGCPTTFASTLSTIDTGQRQVISEFPIGRSASLADIDRATGKVYVSSYSQSEGSNLLVVDPAAHRVLARIPLPNSSSAGAVGVDSASQSVYITNDQGSVTVVDTAANGVRAEIAVGRYPMQIALDSDWNTIYVVNQADNSVSVIDTRSNRVAQTIGVGRRPSGIAVDLTTHLAYVTNSDDGTITVIGR